jgi:hypothetical protein
MYTPIKIKRSDEFYSNYWESYSPKLKREVNFFGDLKYEYWLLVESNHQIINFCERPIKLEQRINGRKEITYFDMWLKWKDQRESFVKIIYSTKLNPQIRSIELNWCKNNGFEYLLINEKDIRTNSILLMNSKHLITTISNQVPNDIDILKVKNLIGKEKTKLEKIFKFYSNSIPMNRIKEAIFWLIYKGTLNSNFHEKIFSMDSEVWIND